MTFAPGELGTEGQAIQARQVHVEQDEPRVPDPDQFSCLLRGGDLANVELVG